MEVENEVKGNYEKTLEFKWVLVTMSLTVISK